MRDTARPVGRRRARRAGARERSHAGGRAGPTPGHLSQRLTQGEAGSGRRQIVVAVAAGAHRASYPGLAGGLAEREAHELLP